MKKNLNKLFIQKNLFKKRYLLILSIVSSFTLINPSIAKEESKLLEEIHSICKEKKNYINCKTNFVENRKISPTKI